MKSLLLAICLVITWMGTMADELHDDPGKYWDFERLSVAPRFEDAGFPDSKAEGMRDILYDGVGPDGTAAKVFAYVSYPETAPGRMAILLLCLSTAAEGLPCRITPNYGMNTAMPQSPWTGTMQGQSMWRSGTGTWRLLKRLNWMAASGRTMRPMSQTLSLPIPPAFP